MHLFYLSVCLSLLFVSIAPCLLQKSKCPCQCFPLSLDVDFICSLTWMMLKYDCSYDFQIIFYEDKNFQGRSYESSSDCADMSSHLNRCHSCKVESGCFVIYDHPNYMGQQYLLKRGEYSDYQRMMGFGECIRSCRMIPMVWPILIKNTSLIWFHSTT